MRNAINESNTPSNVAQLHQPPFEVGETVILSDTDEVATIMAIHEGVAWVFVEIEGFETVDLAEMKRLDPSQQKLG